MSLKSSRNVFCPPWGHVKDSLLAFTRYQNPRHVMFWYGFEPVVNYSVKPLTSVGGIVITYRSGGPSFFPMRFNQYLTFCSTFSLATSRSFTETRAHSCGASAKSSQVRGFVRQRNPWSCLLRLRACSCGLQGRARQATGLKSVNGLSSRLLNVSVVIYSRGARSLVTLRASA